MAILEKTKYTCVKCGGRFLKDEIDTNNLCYNCAQGIVKHYIKGRFDKKE